MDSAREGINYPVSLFAGELGGRVNAMAGIIAACHAKPKENAMWRISLIPLLLIGCVQLPPTPEDIQSKKFESIPDKAAIYIVRTPMDSREPGTISLDDKAQITTYGGTYYRWEVPPGAHRLAGFASEDGRVELNAQGGQIYFVRHTVIGTSRSGVLFTNLQKIGEQEGRLLVSEARLR